MFGIYRLLLAMNVLLYHLGGVHAIGGMAVVSFFVLSGYLMTSIMHDVYGYATDGVIRYATNRFLRLFPIYWVLLLVTILIVLGVGETHSEATNPAMRLPVSIGEWLANVFLIYPEFNPVEYQPRLAPPTWALTIEIFFYVLIGFGISRTKASTAIWLAASVGYVVYANASGQVIGLPGYGNILSASLPFALGSMLYFYRDRAARIRRAATAGRGYLLFAVFFGNLAAAAVSPVVIPDQAWKIETLAILLNIPLSAAMVAYLAGFRSASGLWKTLDRIAGDLSYPVYIFHIPAACLAAWLLGGYGTAAANPSAILVLGIAIALATSVLANLYVSRKIEVLRERVKTSR